MDAPTGERVISPSGDPKARLEKLGPGDCTVATGTHLRLVVPLKGEPRPRVTPARGRLVPVPSPAQLVSLEQVYADMERLFGATAGRPRVRVKP